MLYSPLLGIAQPLRIMKMNKIKTIFVIILVLTISCNSSENDNHSSQIDSAEVETKKSSINDIASIYASLQQFEEKHIYGDSICNKGEFESILINDTLSMQIFEADSIKEKIEQSISASFIGKGKTDGNYYPLFAVRHWGEYFCTVELLVFNKKWKLTGYETVAGIGADIGFKDIGYCELLNESLLKATWISERFYFNESEMESDKDYDSTIVTTTVTQLKIENEGRILKEILKEDRVKL